MEKFDKKISENTIPLILYLISSFLVVFVSNLNYSLIILSIFLLVSTILFDRKIVQKIIVISIIVISIVLFFSMLLSLNFSSETLLYSLPKSISLSIMITSVIAFFVYLPTIQLFYITKTITKNNYPVFAILTAFRVFPVFLNFSKKIFTTIKIRKAYSSYFDFIIFFIQNIIVGFLNYLDDFIKHLTYIDLERIKTKHSFNNLKFYLLTSYLLIILIIIFYER